VADEFKSLIGTGIDSVSQESLVAVLPDRTGAHDGYRSNTSPGSNNPAEINLLKIFVSPLLESPYFFIKSDALVPQ